MLGSDNDECECGVVAFKATSHATIHTLATLSNAEDHRAVEWDISCMLVAVEHIKYATAARSRSRQPGIGGSNLMGRGI